MPSKRFKKGDEVLGMWPGSRLYFKGKIVDVDEGTYDVKFEEGTTYTLLEKHVKLISMLRQVESRTEKNERTGRNRSSSFSRSRSRSRSRTPSRAVEKTPRRSKRLEKSPQKPVKDEESEVEEIQPEEAKVSVVAEEGPRRRSARIAAKVVSTPITSQDEVSAAPQDNGSVKSEEDAEQKAVDEKKPEEDAAGSQEQHSMGNFTAVLMLLTAPVLTLILHALCIQHGGRLTSLPVLNSEFLVSLLDRQALLVLLGFHALGLVSVLLPLGKVLELNGRVFRCNGIYAVLLEILVLYAAKHYFQVQASVVQVLYSKFLFPAIGLGFLGALVAFVKQTRRSSAGPLSDFIVGTDTTVSVGRVNVKHLLMRTGILASIAFNLILVEANFEATGRYSPTLLFTGTLQMTYFLLALWLEGSLPYTFEYSHGTFGLSVSVAYATFPLLGTLSSYTVALNQREIDVVYMVPIVLVFLIGFVILHGSITQKALFRSSPDDTQFAEADTLTSPSGKKLLLSGWWGWMRHPNYFGDLLIHIAQALPCGLTLSVPYLIPLLTFLVMLDRIKRVEKQCKKEHGPAWDRYCERVKYRLLPRIF